MGDPQHGIDFLYDFYAFLKLPRDADVDTITRKWRELNQLYHPDKYAHLAPEFQRQAERKTRHLGLVSATLRDPEQKPRYDVQLAAWTGIIAPSENIPITPAQILQDDAAYDDLKMQYMRAANFSQATYDLLRDQMETTESPSPGLLAAWRAILEQRDVYLDLMEGLEADRLGLQLGDSTIATLQRPELLAAACQQERDRLEERFSRQQTALAAGELKALGPGASAENETVFVSDPSTALVIYQQEKRVHFEMRVADLQKLAEERRELLDERLTLIPANYDPPVGETRQERLLIKLTFQGRALQFGVIGRRVASGEYRPLVTKDELVKPFDTLVCSCEIPVDLVDLLQELICRHFTTFIEQEEVIRSDAEEVA
ncbi:DnaJ domain-containing protein [Candidatus Berkelbacteria bacterium]|nr:DnaJ domain-containing protein [Candidatus Berkelbacteria bacterium]